MQSLESAVSSFKSQAKDISAQNSGSSVLSKATFIYKEDPINGSTVVNESIEFTVIDSMDSGQSLFVMPESNQLDSAPLDIYRLEELANQKSVNINSASGNDLSLDTGLFASSKEESLIEELRKADSVLVRNEDQLQQIKDLLVSVSDLSLKTVAFGSQLISVDDLLANLNGDQKEELEKEKQAYNPVELQALSGKIINSPEPAALRMGSIIAKENLAIEPEQEDREVSNLLDLNFTFDRTKFDSYELDFLKAKQELDSYRVAVIESLEKAA